MLKRFLNNTIAFAAGKIGIGVTPTIYALQVNDTNTNGIAVFGPVSGGTYNGNIRVTYGDQFQRLGSYSGSGATLKTSLMFDANSGAQYHDFDGFVRWRKFTGTTNLMTLLDTGYLGIGTTTPSEMLDVNTTAIRVRNTRTPASAAATGDVGTICWDTNYIYVCVATNTWKRAALGTW